MEIRWQQIRGFERGLLLDNENVALRREIDGLKENQVSADSVHGDTLRIFQKKFTALVKIAREGLKSAKAESAEELNEMASSLKKLQNLVKQVSDHSQSTSEELNRKTMDNSSLAQNLEEVRQELLLSTTSKSSESERLSVQIEKLRQQLGEADYREKVMQDQLEAKELELENQKGTNDGLQDESKRLRLWINKMEMDGLQTVADAEGARKKLIDQHEDVVQSLMSESSGLRRDMEDMINEIDRLNAIINAPPSQTHFSKFVDLKTQNMQLKTKLHKKEKEAAKNDPNVMLLQPPKGQAPPKGGQAKSGKGKKLMMAQQQQHQQNGNRPPIEMTGARTNTNQDPISDELSPRSMAITPQIKVTVPMMSKETRKTLELRIGV